MNRKKILIGICLLAILASAGCITMREAVDTATSMDYQKEVAPVQASIGVLIDDVVPDPYKMPASVALGYGLALLRGMYKRKKQKEYQENQKS